MGDSAGVRLGWRLLTRSLMDMSFGWGEGGGGRAGGGGWAGGSGGGFSAGAD